MPEIAVIMPVFNAGKTVDDSVRSILSQDFEDFELLVHDDGSTDNSRDILKYHASRDTRVRATSGPNRGLVKTLNALLSRSTAPLIARMDADDIALPTRLGKQAAFLEENPDHVVVGSFVVWMNEAGHLIGPLRIPTEHGAIDSSNLQGRCALYHPTTMIRADALRAVGGYRECYRNAEDLDLWLRIAEHGRLANLPEPLLHYRLAASGQSGARRSEQRAYTLKACQSAKARRGVEADFRYTEWRPGTDRASRHRFALKFGWMAWRNGHRRTVRHYIARAITTAPFSLESWRFAFFGLLRRPSGKGADHA